MEFGGYGAVCVAGMVVVAIAAVWATPWSGARSGARADDDELHQTINLESVPAPQEPKSV
jgi:hypothetical protein